MAAALQSLKSLLVPECEDISHAFYALSVAVHNDFGRRKTFKEVADIKYKLQCERATVKNHATYVESFQAAQQAKAQCSELEALQLSGDMPDEQIASKKCTLEHSSEALRGAKRLRPAQAL